MTTGYGDSTYGNSPWGGQENLPTTEMWDIYYLWSEDMDRVSVFYGVTLVGAGDQFFISPLNIYSGGAYSGDDAQLHIDVPVSETFTLEYHVTFHELPPDTSDRVNEHIYLGASDGSGPVAGFLFSTAGVEYTGSVHFDGSGDIVFDNPWTANPEEAFTLLPNSDTWFTPGVPTTVRIVVDTAAGITYLFITPTDELASGMQLRALLPVLKASDQTTSPPDEALISVRGTASNPSHIAFTGYSMANSALIPNLPPRAVVGQDQTSRMCSIVQLDGSGSFDPEGEDLEYSWRMIDGPETSQYIFAGADGSTSPETPATGYTDQFYTTELEAQHTAEPIQAGDVLLVGGIGYSVASVKPDGDPPPFYVLVEKKQIPDDLTGATYKLVRQAGISGATEAKPSFYPDVPGFYLFDLMVFDGLQWSTPTGLQRATSVVNVLESPLPRGCTPDVSFVFDYLSDFWGLVEDSEKLQVFWSSLAQVAATELLTLWQHEYSKSIRDIQRTFIRRWLHYDLVLGEPVPELTSTHPVWGGVQTSEFAELRLNNQTLVLSSNLFEEDQVVRFSTLDPVDPEAFAAGLQRHLREIHSSFTVDLLTMRSGNQVLRVSSAFEFTVGASSTCTLFTTGDVNGSLSGTGVRAGGGSFKTDRTLQGLDLSGAFLVVDGTAYAIDRTADVSTDAYPYQRVVVRETLPAMDDSVSWVICGYVESQLLDFYAGLVSDGDHVDLEVLNEDDQVASTAQTAEVVECTAYGASETYPTRLPVDLGPVSHYLADDTLSVRLARVLRRRRVPVDELVQDIPVLQEKVVVEDDEETLRRNLDFYIEEYRGRNCVRFVSGQDGGPDVFEGERPPLRLWAEYTYLDNSPTIEDNFGLPVGFTQDQIASLPSTVDYLSAVRGLLYARVNGPTMYNLRVGTQILLGLPFAEEDGVIEEIRTDLLSDTGRILVRDSKNTEVVRSYTFPKVLSVELNPETGERYQVGDTVARFAPLVEGVEVMDYVKDPRWFEGLIGQGVFLEIEKFHTFLLRIDSRAYSYSSLLLIRNFILSVKPTYTYPRIAVLLDASDADGDEIDVSDTIKISADLQFDDSLCVQRIGASLCFDQPWPGGGQPWDGDTAGHNRCWRNAFDQDDDASTYPAYPNPEQVSWGYDKEQLCPNDEVAMETCEAFGASFVPPYDSSFGFDRNTGETFTGENVGAFTIPAGDVGYVLTLTSNTITRSGEITEVRLALLGVTGDPAVDEVDFRVVVNVNGGAAEGEYSFTASSNTEVVAPFSISVSPSDTIQVSIRTESGNSATPGWTKILTRVTSSDMWQFDTTLAAGSYCGSRQLTGT